MCTKTKGLRGAILVFLISVKGYHGEQSFTLFYVEIESTPEIESGSSDGSLEAQGQHKEELSSNQKCPKTNVGSQR